MANCLHMIRIKKYVIDPRGKFLLSIFKTELENIYSRCPQEDISDVLFSVLNEFHSLRSNNCSYKISLWQLTSFLSYCKQPARAVWLQSKRTQVLRPSTNTSTALHQHWLSLCNRCFYLLFLSCCWCLLSLLTGFLAASPITYLPELSPVMPYSAMVHLACDCRRLLVIEDSHKILTAQQQKGVSLRCVVHAEEGKKRKILPLSADHISAYNLTKSEHNRNEYIADVVKFVVALLLLLSL